MNSKALSRMPSRDMALFLGFASTMSKIRRNFSAMKDIFRLQFHKSQQTTFDTSFSMQESSMQETSMQNHT
jgi:hypothetical protein